MINDLNLVQWDYLLSPEFELINSAGKPLTGGYIEVYIHGTRDKYYCALSFDGTLHPFQIPLDALGSNIILADPANAYDVYVYNKYGSLVMSRYNVHCQGGNGGSSTYIGDRLFYGQYRASNVTTIANLSKNKGNINLSPEGYLKLKEDMSYHITVRGAFKVDDVSNVDTTLNYIEYSSVNPIKVDVDYTKEGPQYFELSYDLYRLPEDMDYQVAFDESNGMVTDLIVEVHSLSNLSTTAQAGDVYDSGWGIDITNNIISVDPSILEDYVTAEEVIAIVSSVTGLTPGSEYTAGDYISIVNNEISVTGINPEDYATHTEVYEATVTAVNTVTGLIPEEEEVEFEEINLEDYALASAIPVVTGFATHDEVHEATVTAIDTVTGLIPELPDEEEVEFEEINLEDYALASAIPDVSDFTTHTEVYEATVTAVQIATGLIPELPDEEEVEFEEINLSDYALASAIPDVSDFTTHSEVHEAIVTAVNTVTSLIPDPQVQSDWAQETVTAVDFIKNKPDEVEIIAGQNIGLFEGDGTLTIAASAVDLSDYTTFEDVMEIVTGVTGLNDYGQFYATSVTGTAEMSRTKGTIALTNDGKLKLVKGSSYHITVRGRYDVATAINTFTDVSYIEAITNTGIHVNVDNTITDSQYFELSYDLYKLNSDTNYTVSFTGLAGSINDLYLEIHSLDGIGGGGGSGPVTGGGVEYDAGWGINILNNVISVDSSILNNYATKDELQDSIELVTGLIPQSQVQSDWTEIDNSDPAYIKNKPQQVNLVAGQNIGIAVTGTNIVISASATDLSDYATTEQLQDSVELVTGLIPDVSDLVTDTELQSAISIVREEIPTIQLNANNQVTAIDNYEIAGGSVTGTFVQVQSNWTEDDDSEPSYIQNKPSEQSLVAGNGISLTSSGNTVTISAEVPTVTGFVTEAQLQSVSGTLHDEIEAVEAELPDEEEVEFEELDLSDYALASAIPDVSTFATKTELQAVEEEIPVVTGFATKDELDAVSGLITPELPVVAGEGISITETESEITIAVSGDFATQSDIPVVTGFATKDEVQSVAYQNKILTYGSSISMNDLYEYLNFNPYLGQNLMVKITSSDLPSAIYYKLGSYTQPVFAHYTHTTMIESGGNQTLCFEAPITVTNYVGSTLYPQSYIIQIMATQASVYSDPVTWSVSYKELKADSDIVWVTLTYSSNTWTGDKTIAELNQARTDGKLILLKYNEPGYSASFNPLTPGFQSFGRVYMPSKWSGSTIYDQNNIFCAVYIGRNYIESSTYKPMMHILQANGGNDSSTVTFRDILGEPMELAKVSELPDVSTLATKTELTSVTGTLQGEIEAVSATIPELPDEEEVEFETIDLSNYALASAIPDISNLATNADLQTVSAAIPDTSDMATQTWVDNQGYLTSIPSNYVTETELTGAVSGFATKSELSTVESEIPVVTGFATKSELNSKQNTLTGITDIQVVNSLPGSPVATVLYLIPEV